MIHFCDKPNCNVPVFNISEKTERCRVLCKAVSRTPVVIPQDILRAINTHRVEDGFPPLDPGTQCIQFKAMTDFKGHVVMKEDGYMTYSSVNEVLQYKTCFGVQCFIRV